MGLRLENIKKPRTKGNSKRKGRGIGSGRGKTSGKGHKGAKSRSGGGTYNPGFEGGQMPMIRRLPKRGFTNKWRREWSVINVGTLDKTESIAAGSVIDKNFLLDNKILRKKRLPFKVLGKGKLSKSITVKANAFSETAKKAIESAGGKAEVVAHVVRVKAEEKKG
jgi:large subunit ribosomal protein L15